MKGPQPGFLVEFLSIYLMRECSRMRELNNCMEIPRGHGAPSPVRA